MSGGFIAKPLGLSQIDQAYPLVRAIAPDLGIARWRAFAAARIGGRTAPEAPAGIVTVQNERGYIHGLFSYSVDDSLQHGRTLTVDTVVALDLFDQAGAASSLVQAMEGLARRLDCAAILTSLPERGAGPAEDRHGMAAVFRDAGHHVEGQRLCKTLDGGRDTVSQAAAKAGGDG